MPPIEIWFGGIGRIDCLQDLILLGGDLAYPCNTQIPPVIGDSPPRSELIEHRSDQARCWCTVRLS